MLAGEIIDATALNKWSLVTFIGDQIARAKSEGVLFSLHLKATMMKVSDPIIFATPCASSSSPSSKSTGTRSPPSAST